MYYDDEDHRSGGSRNAVLDIPVTDFELSVRSRNCLKKMNIKTLGDLLKTTEQELLSYKNFGETSLNEIKQLLAHKGLRLGQAVDGAAAALAGLAGAAGRGRRPPPPLGLPARRPVIGVRRRPGPRCWQERDRAGAERPQPKGAAAAEHQHPWRAGQPDRGRAAGVQELRCDEFEPRSSSR